MRRGPSDCASPSPSLTRERSTIGPRSLDPRERQRSFPRPLLRVPASRYLVDGRVGNVFRHLDDPIHHDPTVQLPFPGGFLPGLPAHVADPVGAPDHHGEFGLLRRNGHRVVQRGREIIERTEPHLGSIREEKPVVLRVRVRAADEPVEDQRIKKPPHIVAGTARPVPDQIENVARRGTAVVLVFQGGQFPQSLTGVL